MDFEWYSRRANIVKKKIKAGGPLKFESPKEFWEAAKEYFQEMDKAPAFETVYKFNYGECIQSEIPRKRPYTKGSLCIFMNIYQDTYNAYSRRPEFAPVCKMIDEIIRSQKFDGACAGFFHPMIISRDLGLVDKQETEHRGKIEITDPMQLMKEKGIPIPDIDLEDIE